MRQRASLWLLGTLGACAVTLAGDAAAAEQAVQGEAALQRFEPAPGGGNYLSVAGLRMDGHWGWSAGIVFNYARNPLVVVSCRSAEDCDEPSGDGQDDVAIVRDMLTWDLLASVTPVPRVQVGLRVPLSYVNGDGLNAETGGPGGAPLRTFGAGDPMLEAKARLLGGSRDLLVLGGAGFVSFPVGHASASGSYLGNDSPVTFGLRGLADVELGAFSVGLNLTGVFRESATVGSASVGPEMRYGVGAGYRVSPVVRIVAEGFGATRFSAEAGSTSLEVDGALQVQPLGSSVVLSAGGAAGVTGGYGVPQLRGIGSVMFVYDGGDGDTDGVPDRDDRCPTIAEDRDGFEDADGCPEDDNDRDGILDRVDECPDQPETRNKRLDDDGCPDTNDDKDGDGVTDHDDMCPEQKGALRGTAFAGCPDGDEDGVPDANDKCEGPQEDTDGFEDADGCPELDNDADGVLDESDECLNDREILNGWKDEDGCPDDAPDKDGDGVSDGLDRCPTVAETYNGIQDGDGCPEVGPRLVEVTDGAIRILERVEFANGSDKIVGPKSLQVLGAVAGVLKNHPEIFLVEVAGHTDDVGPADANRALSQKRADAVRSHLVSQGVEASRLVAKGYGPDKPLADNGTLLGKQKNRRVEMVILKSRRQQQLAATSLGGDLQFTEPEPPAPPPAPPPEDEELKFEVEPPPPAPPPAKPAPAPGKPDPKAPKLPDDVSF